MAVRTSRTRSALGLRSRNPRDARCPSSVKGQRWGFTRCPKARSAPCPGTLRPALERSSRDPGLSSCPVPGDRVCFLSCASRAREQHPFPGRYLSTRVGTAVISSTLLSDFQEISTSVHYRLQHRVQVPAEGLCPQHLLPAPPHGLTQPSTATARHPRALG